MSSLTTTARILIVEDEILIATEIEERLSRLGYQVLGSRSTAQDAYAAVVELLPDLVLMDIRLKGDEDGIEAADRIYGGHGIPVVFLTAHSDNATIVRAKSTRPFGYVLKPFQERELIAAIETAMQRHTAERELQESRARFEATLSSIGDGVIATDSDGRVEFMNSVAEELSGWAFEEAIRPSCSNPSSAVPPARSP